LENWIEHAFPSELMKLLKAELKRCGHEI